MKDFIPTNYCDLLWINDLLSLKQETSKKEYVTQVEKSNKKYFLSFQNVTIFGTIVEVRQMGDKGFLYSVDDGTGVIQCKHTNEQFIEIVDLIEDEREKLQESVILNNTSNNCTKLVNESTKCDDDTVFNDKSVQKEEISVIKKNELQDFQTLWGSILESFESLINEFSVGDTVYVQGKLYSYFHRNQIYINSIRLMDVHEELKRIRRKLEFGFEPLVKVKTDEKETSEADKTAEETTTNPKRKFSGIITFDHIHHLEIKVPPNKYITPKRKLDGEDNINPRKRNSIVSPYLGGALTFDTRYNDESFEMDDL